jgi:hypothetical protein
MCSPNVMIGFLTWALLASSVRAANSLESLAQKCGRQDQRSCRTVQNEMQRCKGRVEGCISVLSGLPDSTLTAIAGDGKVEKQVVDSANDLLRNRREERDRREAEERAARAQREADERAARAQRQTNFSKLSRGMSVAEVEATIGPLVAGTSFGSINLARTIEFDMKMGMEQHEKVSIQGRQASLQSSMVTNGGNPEKSSYIWDSDEFLLAFDHMGKLKEFIYRGGP